MNVKFIIVYYDKDNNKFCFPCAVKKVMNSAEKIMSVILNSTDCDVWQSCEECGDTFET